MDIKKIFKEAGIIVGIITLIAFIAKMLTNSKVNAATKTVTSKINKEIDNVNKAKSDVKSTETIIDSTINKSTVAKAEVVKNEAVSQATQEQMAANAGFTKKE